jgi:hypothetical protein
LAFPDESHQRLSPKALSASRGLIGKKSALGVRSSAAARLIGEGKLTIDAAVSFDYGRTKLVMIEAEEK